MLSMAWAKMFSNLEKKIKQLVDLQKDQCKEVSFNLFKKQHKIPNWYKNSVSS